MTDATPPELLPMRDVVSLTGINPVTLRAWERRHGLIHPQRTEGGHRLYTAQDVQRIRDILRWTANGLPISKVGDRLAGQPEAPVQQPSAFDDWRAAVAASGLHRYTGGRSIGAPGRNVRRRRRRRDSRKVGRFVGGEPFRVPPCVSRRAGQRSLFHVSVDLFWLVYLFRVPIAGPPPLAR